MILAILWPSVKTPEKVRKITLIATLLSGLTISALSLMEIFVLGEGIVSHTIYPLYVLVRQISIADFLENLDAMVALNMIITAYIKISINLFAAIRAIQILLNTLDNRPIILPVTAIAYLLGMTMSNNINEHIYVGITTFPLYVWVPLLIVLPIMLLIVTVIRRKLFKALG